MERVLVTVDLRDRVAAALEAMGPMLPKLSAYASGLTGKSIRVEAGPTTQTDGRTIWIRPPLDLADAPEDIRNLCGVRDENGTLECPGCSVRESVLVKIRHEVGHIIHGSFERISNDYLIHCLDAVGVPTSTIPRTRLMLADPMHMAKATGNKALMTLMQVADDVRVDSRNVEISAGFEEVYRSARIDMLRFGLDGDGVPATALDEHVQMMLGLLTVPVIGSVGDLICESARNIAEDEQVLEILSDLTDVSSAVDATAQLYRRLIDLGVYSGQEFEEQDEDEGDQGDEDGGEGGSSEGSPGEGGGGEGGSPVTGDQIAEAMQAVAKALGHEPGESTVDGLPASQMSADDPDGSSEAFEIEQAIEEVLTQVKETGAPQLGVGSVNVRRAGQGRLRGKGKLKPTPVPESILGDLVMRGRAVFAENQRVKYHRDRTRGRVAPSVLGRRGWNPEDKRLFAQRHVPDTRKYSILVGIDNSGSTSGELSRMLRQTSLAIAQMCHRIGVGVGVYAHTSETQDVEIYEMKALGDPWRPELEREVWRLGIGHSNADGTILRVYRRQLEATDATDKILLFFTDGVIPGYGGSAQAQIMREEVQACKRAGITLVGVGVGTDSPKQFGIETVRLDSEKDLRALLEYLADKIRV